MKPIALIVRCVLPALFAVLLPLSASAQGKNRLISQEEISKFENLKFSDRADLVSGAIKLSTKEDKDKVALMARYWVYRMTIPEHQANGNVATWRNQGDEFVKNSVLFDKDLPKNKDFRDLFARELITCFKTVFARNVFGEMECDTLSCINAGLFLPTLGRLDNIEIMDFLSDLVRDPGKPGAPLSSALAGLATSALGQGPVLTTAVLAPGRTYGTHDAIKLFGFKAMREFLSHAPPEMDFKFAVGFLDKAKRVKMAERLNPLIDYILNPPHLATQAEIDGYRYIRCEAIKALAQVPVPYVPEEPDVQTKVRGKILAPTAYTLMRVLAEGNDALSPPPTLAEQCEAAMGLARIDSKIVLEENLPSLYNEELAVALVGKFLVRYIQAYNADRGNFLGTKKSPPKLPWKVYTKTITLTFDGFNKNLSPMGKAKQQMADLIQAMSGPMNAIATWQQVGGSESQLLGLVGALSPADTAAYLKTAYQVRLK